MKWDQQGDHSRNVEDRRGQAPRGGGLRGAGGKLSVGGLLLLVVAFLGNKYLGGGAGGGGAAATQAGLEELLGGGGATEGGGGAPPAPDQDPDLELKRFSSATLDDVQDHWIADFKRRGERYQEAKLVLFSGATESACGYAGSDIGPFYCPGDTRVYIDLSFFRELHRRFGAPGDFAQAYVLAHEVGHHVQNLRGDSERVERATRKSPRRQNELSIQLELQADCLAGVWAHSTRQRALLEAGDLEEGLGAASAVGDDRLQEQATGRVNPETWTHGSSEQRVASFKKGMASGDVTTCDFAIP